MPKRNPDQGVLFSRVAEAQKLVSGLVTGWLDLMSVVPDLLLIVPSYLFLVCLVSGKFCILQIVICMNLAKFGKNKLEKIIKGTGIGLENGV